MIFRIDEDRVVRTGGDAGLASDADVLVEVDDTVGPAIHRRCRARGDARRVIALIAARHLKGAARRGKLADVDRLHIRAIDAEGNGVFGFAGGGARMASDALRVVDDLGPLEGSGFNSRQAQESYAVRFKRLGSC